MAALVRLRLIGKDDIAVDHASLFPPVRGRRMYVSTDDDGTRFKEFFLKALSLKALKAAAAQQFKVDASKISCIYRRWMASTKVLIEIESDAQVEELTDETMLVVKFADV